MIDAIKILGSLLGNNSLSSGIGGKVLGGLLGGGSGSNPGGQILGRLLGRSSVGSGARNALFGSLATLALNYFTSRKGGASGNSPWRVERQRQQSPLTGSP